MLKTTLRNLISNAIKFTDSEGSIKVNALQKNNCIAITISDDGVGMNEETMNNLFQLHTNVTVLGTAKENGSGLGLLLCKKFAENTGENLGRKQNPKREYI
jgi:two-component system sensor histidine kinase/response regulator